MPKVKPTLSIVPVDAIPKGEDVSLDSPMQIYKICQGLEELCVAEGGIGISAVQAGIPLKLFLINRGDKESGDRFEYYINCEFEPLSENKMFMIEGCLSLKTEHGITRQFKIGRYSHIHVKGLKLNKDVPSFEEYDEIFQNDFLGTVFQHEIQHQHQILISDVGQEVTIVW